ncbi:MAG: hypothetical protein PVI98_04500 [Burkholderiales bacterium]|jgi:hypothetical protein
MMTNADVHAELLRLRKQVEELARARKQQEAKSQPEDDDVEMEPESSEAENTIKQHIDDLMKLLQEEIHDMPALPTLAVFMLGVLVGRYLR